MLTEPLKDWKIMADKISNVHGFITKPMKGIPFKRIHLRQISLDRSKADV